MKKHKIFLTLALLFASISFAIPKGPCDKKEVCCEETEPGPFAFYYPKDMNLSCPNGFYVKGEFLLVQVKEEGLEYAITQKTGEPGLDENRYPLTPGDIQGYSTGHRNWDWTAGCRVGFGFYLNRDMWNIEAEWTYMRINNDSGKNLSGGVLLPFWLPPTMIVEDDAIASSARWTGNINTLDLKLGKPYHISRYVIFNPHMGLRMAWIDQDYTSRNSGTFYLVGTDPDTDLVVKNKNDFWGIGLRAGLDTEWHFGTGWYLFGKASGSLLYSHFDIYQDLIFNTDTLYQLKHDFYTNSPNMEIILGLCWSHLFSKNKYMLSLKAAYEMHQWWEQNRLRRFFDEDVSIEFGSNSASSSNDEVARGDLTVNGFSFAIQFDF
jgi:hypothetical protein